MPRPGGDGTIHDAILVLKGRGSACDQDQGSRCDQGQGSECDQGQGLECDQGLRSIWNHHETE